MEITTSWKEEGKQELILSLLTYRLGELSSKTQSQVMNLNSSQLDELGLGLFNLENEEGLKRWLANSLENQI